MILRVLLAGLAVVLTAAGTVTGSVLQSRQAESDLVQAQIDAASQPSVPAPPPLPPPVPTSTVPPPPPPPPPPPTPKPVNGTPCLSNVSVCVTLAARKAWLISDGKVILGPVSITSGKSGEATPKGFHRVLWKDADHKSKEFDDAPMPWSVFFAAGGIAFHTGSLRAESNGCVHLADSVARRFYQNLAVGDVVQVLR